VWIFPVWWMDAPAVMKNFWDRNFTWGFAYKTHPDGKIDRLLKWKTAKVFATAWGPAWIIGFLLGLIWKQGRFGFVWIKTTDFRVFKNTPLTNEKEKNTFLQSL
jgi:putative NADPH-quinone reductase